MAKLVYQKKSGKWEARYQNGRTPDGKISYGSVYGDSEEEVIRKRAELLNCNYEDKSGAQDLNLLILGAGVHGHDVKQIAESLRIFKKISFLDDNVSDIDVIGKCSDYARYKQGYACAFVAIGDNEVRLNYASKLCDCGYLMPALVSPRANVSPNAKIGNGVAILPQSTVNDAEIGDYSIIDYNSLVNSGASIGAYARIDCGAMVLKGAKVPESAWIKSGEIHGDK